MKRMASAVLILLAALGLSISAHAQKLYKIVDEEGNVTFSQFPPQEKSENAIIDEHKVSGSAQSNVREMQGNLYCGDIRLASKKAQEPLSTRDIERLETMKTRWIEQRDRLSQRIDKTNQNKIRSDQYRTSTSGGQHYMDSIERQGAELRDVRCAIAWADDQLDGSRELVHANNQERARLQGQRDELQGRLDRRCGELPKYAPNDSGNAAARKYWYDCSASLRKEIKRVDRALGSL